MNLGWMQSPGFEWFTQRQNPAQDETENFAFQAADQDVYPPADDAKKSAPVLSTPLTEASLPEQEMAVDDQLQNARDDAGKTSFEPVMLDDAILEIDPLLDVGVGPDDLPPDDLAEDEDALQLEDFMRQFPEKEAGPGKSTSSENDLPVWEIEMTEDMFQGTSSEDLLQKKSTPNNDSPDPSKASNRGSGDSS